MKKIIFLGLLFVSCFLASCEKDEIGGTVTESMAGEWYVTADAINADGSIWDVDVFGLGNFLISTYNTASNNSSEMWIDDSDQFGLESLDIYLPFKSKMSIDINAGTFKASSVSNAYDDESEVTILNGKILPKAATTPNGMPADSIVFEISFSNDPLPEEFEFARYRISGYRYTGLAGDD